MALQNKAILFVAMFTVFVRIYLYQPHLTLRIITVDHSKYVFILIEKVILITIVELVINEKFLRQEALDQAVKKDMRSNPDNIQEAVLGVELVYKQSMYGYGGKDKLPFLKITVAVPKLIAPCKRLLEQDSVYTFFTHHYKAFESNIDFDIRYVMLF